MSLVQKPELFPFSSHKLYLRKEAVNEALQFK